MKSFGNLILMTVICIVIFWIFMAIRPANAGMQGNMPKPVQPLPKYPPIVCVAPNWAITPCRDRQPQVPQPVSDHMPSLVGERGPEMFVPNQPGVVIPLPRSDPRRDLSGLRGMMEGIDNYINWGQQTNLPGSLAPASPQQMLPIPTDEQIRAGLHAPFGGPASLEDLSPAQQHSNYLAEQFYPTSQLPNLRINPEAWDRFLREQVPSKRVEYREPLSEKEQKKLRWEEYMKKYEKDPNRA
jgi:hypothetical protein